MRKRDESHFYIGLRKNYKISKINWEQQKLKGVIYTELWRVALVFYKRTARDGRKKKMNCFLYAFKYDLSLIYI